MKKIIVGVDGSPQAKAALSWAVQEAQLRGGAVEGLYAYGPPEEHNPYALAYAATAQGALYATHLGAPDAPAARLERERRIAEATVRGMLRDVCGDTSDVTVTARLVADARPVRALIAASEDADLLVVGTRGRGPLKSAVLGSLSQTLRRRAHCPVVVVHPEGVVG